VDELQNRINFSTLLYIIKLQEQNHLWDAIPWNTVKVVLEAGAVVQKSQGCQQNDLMEWSKFS